MWRKNMLRQGAAVMGAILVATLAAAPQASAAAVEPKAPQTLKSVSGSPIGVRPPTVSTAAELRGPLPVAWPDSATADVSIVAALATAAKPAQAGKSPVFVGGVDPKTDPAKVRVQVLGQDESAKAGVAGLLVKVARTDGVKAAGPVSLSLDYNGFRHAYGGDWASRLRLVQLGSAEPVGVQSNDLKAGRLTSRVPASSEGTVFALAAGPEGATGDYKATSLAPSSEWKVSQQTGSFSWNYPLRMPPVPGGLSPSFAPSYDSGSVDGRVATTNNQTSWLGEGWDMSAGYIERRYKGCVEDLNGNQGTTKTGDLCWAMENATLSMGGRSGQLVQVGSTDVWRLKNDDGSKLEHLYGTKADNGDDNGEHWRLTTTDGTQYYFGRNKMPDGRPDAKSTWTVPVAGNHGGEPCNKATFDASFCDQAYRWNLDYVVDTHGNNMFYAYDVETNKYSRNLGKSAAEYTRGGTLKQVDYGTRAGDSAPAPVQVVFQPADRCVPGADCSKKVKESWPDVPWERVCDTEACGDKQSPTFFTTKRLSAVTTQVRDGTSYKPVERWTFNHTYPLPGDNTDPAMWLAGIGHEGLVGTPVSTPPVTFVLDPNTKANRVDGTRDGLPPSNKHRILSINTESGGEIAVNYKKAECTSGATPAPDTNAMRCFPVRWTPDKVEPVDDWFHKYVVDSVAQIDRVGGAPTQFTSYDYETAGAWAYNDDPFVAEKYRSWTQWRGFETVRVRKGDPNNPGQPIEAATRYHYFRGMHGDKLKAGGTKSVQIAGRNDDPPLAGFLREQIQYDGRDGAEVGATTTDPWVSGPSATQGAVKALMVKVEATYTRTKLASGGHRKTESRTSYDQYGFPEYVSDSGDIADADDDRCTKTTYARNTDKWMLSLPSRVETLGVKCTDTPVFPRDAITDVLTYYDQKEWNVAPAEGNATTTKSLEAHNGTPGYITDLRTGYDGYGRVVESFDALDRKTSTIYTPAIGLTTSTTVTNPLGHQMTTTSQPAWNLPTTAAGPNGERTDTVYDGLGRTTAVWAPGRAKEKGFGPSIRFSYNITNSGASSIRTEKLMPNTNYLTSYALFDGFLRERQTQEPTPQGGRKLTDVLYDTRGLVDRRNSAYFNDESGPAPTLFGPLDNQIPSQTVTRYDGAERPFEVVYEKLDEPQWKTTTIYGGDHTTTVPPAGGTPTTTYTDAKGQIEEVRQYTTGVASGAYNSTKRTYTKGGQLASVTDAVGNVWTTSYDVAGNLIRINDPDKGETRMTYDKVGQIRTTSDSRDKTTVTEYDDLGREIRKRADSDTGPVLATWSYDKIKKGMLDSTTRFVGADQYVKRTTGFDDASRPTDVELVIPAVEGQPLAKTYKTSTTYLADGSIGTVALPALGDLPAETVTYGYNEWGLPSNTGGAGVKYVANSTYTALGELTQLEFGTGDKRVWQTRHYEDGTRRTHDVVVERDNSPTPELDKVTYGYDPSGNSTTVDTLTARTASDRQCFGYDGLRRLTEAWTTSAQTCGPAGGSVGGAAPYWKSYGYDAVGRRKSQVEHGLNGADATTTTTTYPEQGQPRPHAPVSVSATGPLRAAAAAGAFSYDEAGNAIARPGAQTYTWDVQGQLTSATVNGATTNYVNTLDNERLVARQAGSTTLYLASGEVRWDRSTGIVTGTRYYLHGQEAVAVRSGKVVQYLTSDLQGTGNLAVNADTLQATKRRFDPFGVARGASTPWLGDRGFVGGAADSSTKLTRLGVRDYDPASGTFVSVDPELGQDNPQQLNAYSYAVNNPTTFADPTGERPEDVPGYCLVWRGDCGYNPVDDVKVHSGFHTPEKVKRVAKAARVGYAPVRSGKSPKSPMILIPVYWNKKKQKAFPVGMSPFDLYDRVNLTDEWFDDLASCDFKGPAHSQPKSSGCDSRDFGDAARRARDNNNMRNIQALHPQHSSSVSFSVCISIGGAGYAVEGCLAVDEKGIGWSAGAKEVYGPGGMMPNGSASIKMSEGTIKDLGGKDSGGSIPYRGGVDLGVSKSDSGLISWSASTGIGGFTFPTVEKSEAYSGYFTGGR